jgi:hypothetical protein
MRTSAGASEKKDMAVEGTHLATAERENLFGGKVHATQLPVSWPEVRVAVDRRWE